MAEGGGFVARPAAQTPAPGDAEAGADRSDVVQQTPGDAATAQDVAVETVVPDQEQIAPLVEPEVSAPVDEAAAPTAPEAATAAAVEAAAPSAPEAPAPADTDRTPPQPPAPAEAEPERELEVAAAPAAEADQSAAAVDGPPKPGPEGSTPSSGANLTVEHIREKAAIIRGGTPDAPPVDVKVYTVHLRRQLNAPLFLDHEGTTLRTEPGGEVVCRLGDAVRVRMKGRDAKRDRWIFELERR